MAEAKKFAGFSVPELQDPGWRLDGQVRVMKIVGRNNTVDRVEADYRRGGAVLTTMVSQPETSPSTSSGSPMALQIQGVRGSISRGTGNPDFVQVSWDKGGMSFEAWTYESALPMDAFLRAVESIR
jgi:hypothetical protein